MYEKSGRLDGLFDQHSFMSSPKVPGHGGSTDGLKPVWTTNSSNILTE